jgi:hypothetical protein
MSQLDMSMSQQYGEESTLKQHVSCGSKVKEKK